MGINSIERQCVKIPSKSISSKGNLPSSVKVCITTDSSITSSVMKTSSVHKNKNMKSPYLADDSVHLYSRPPEKKVLMQHKMASDFISSFPLASSIYRANSDEFNSTKKANKKVKKSVLTLPNVPAEAPQNCTVSDTNESKYFDPYDENRSKRTNKRLLPQNRKSRVRNREKNYQFYDRDARYCSQMNINLDCSSTDMINQFTGDGKRVTGRMRSNTNPANEQEFNAHDVWAVLRNINRFQFRPSPPMSEDSIQTVKKKKIRNKKKNTRKDTRVIETCRTEEFAYISNYEVDTKSPNSFSRSSSFDRITVVNTHEEFSEICNDFEKNILKPNNMKTKNRQYTHAMNNSQKNNEINNRLKTVGHKELRNKNQRDLSPDTTYHSILDNPETLVAKNSKPVSVHPEKKYPTDIYKCNGPKVFEARVNRAKISSGTLHSGSSKAEVDISRNVQDCNSDQFPDQPSNHSQQIKGITRVILNKGRMELPNKKPQQNAFQSPAIAPKLTQTEIKRRLANLKFPIVVLGKDQLTSTFMQVSKYEYPHLQALNQQMWPYMLDWYDKGSSKNDRDSLKISTVEKKLDESNISKNKQLPLECKRRVNQVTGKNKALNEEFTINKKKTLNLKRPVLPNVKRPVVTKEITEDKPQSPKKSKPMRQFKDKMLKLLYKNAPAKESDRECKSFAQKKSSTSCVCSIEITSAKVANKADVSTETVMNQNSPKNNSIIPRSETWIDPKPAVTKSKWASDFIDTVIKRIRSGVYYNNENKHKITDTDLKNESVQTLLTGESFNTNKGVIVFQDKIKTKKSTEAITEIAPYSRNNVFETLPGFRENVPAFEIKTLNMKEVAIKHCTTNVLVQFDIAMPSGPLSLNNLQNTSSFIPLDVTESQTKIFKCKTTLINAMLPAEICSLLPKIIRNIIESNKPPALPPLTTSFQNESPLYTISELSQCESQDIIKTALPSFIPMTPKLMRLLGGSFSSKNMHIPVRSINKRRLLDSNYNKKISELLIKLPATRIMPVKADPFSVDLSLANGKDILQKKCNVNRTDIKTIYNSCTSLVLYNDTNFKLETDYEKCVTMLNVEKPVFMMRIETKPLLLTFYDNKDTLSMSRNNHSIESQTSIIIDNINYNFICQKLGEFAKHEFHNNDRCNNNNVIEYDKNLDKSEKEQNEMQSNKKHLKARKKTFVKLYRNCKSTSNISGEKHSTSLSKITNLEDFFQALGTGKALCNVFDELSGRKILSSLLEIKNWITEISPRQAMLVLLLNNKKDTQNLVRFRPILLQGIAVNRITRASELDMEIEVIERENFNKFSKFEGIPYVPESVENYDRLLEELYWIAKTTASDYQKPFNEASEKLLKSLLEKRKKLNPSYLRVMARYVGLGLLKSPTKN